jgi:hypothetical protein
VAEYQVGQQPVIYDQETWTQIREGING